MASFEMARRMKLSLKVLLILDICNIAVGIISSEILEIGCISQGTMPENIQE